MDDALFEIECRTPMVGTDTAYAENADAAFAAYHQLRRDAGLMGSKVKITNLATGEVVWNEEA